jgi:beta-N-acetylhexosaminidase
MHLRNDGFRLIFTSIQAFLFFIAIISCNIESAAGKKGFIIRNSRIAPREITTVFSGMSVTEKASQVLMTGIDGKKSFPPYLNRHFGGMIPGAVLLFRFNIADTPQEVAVYLQSCEKAFSALGASVPVLIAIDHEGGDVFRTAGVTSYLPSAQAVASRYTAEKAESLYELSARQLRYLGIHMNLAPVVETLTPGNKAFLGSRSFSSDPEISVRYAKSAVSGYRKGGILTVLKHFPGNGKSDPHSALPSIDAGPEEFDAVYLQPFRELLAAGPDAVLVSHILVSSIDPLIPFCLSRKGVTGLLRGSLGFQGMVITDDISMSAIADHGYGSAEAAVLALRAGCDMIMTSDPEIRTIAAAIAEEAGADPEFMKILDSAVMRILETKYRAGLVKTAMERYSDTRQSDFFNSGYYSSLREKAALILEERNDR